MSPAQHAGNYFGLMEDLQRLFSVPIDLIDPGPIRNLYFRQPIAASQAVLYEAA